MRVPMFEPDEVGEFGYEAKSSLELSKIKTSLDFFGSFLVKQKRTQTIENQ